MSPYRVFPILTVSLICLVCAFQAKANSAPAKSVRTDAYGDPLPPGALLRLGTVRWRARAHFLAFMPDDKTLVTGGHDGFIRLWDTSTGKQTESFHAPGSWAYALSPDGKTLAVDGGNAIVFVSMADGKEVRRAEAVAPVPGVHFSFNRVDFSRDGKQLAAVGSDGVVRLYDAGTGKMTFHLAGEMGGYFPTTFSPDGKVLALVGEKNTLRVLEISTAIELFNQLLPSKNVVEAVRMNFALDGKRVAVVEKDGILAIRNIARGEKTLSFPRLSEEVSKLCFSPDGKQLASAGVDRKGAAVIRLWDASTSKELRELATSKLAEDDMGFSHDGKCLASVDSVNGVVHLWDVETGEEISRAGEHQGLVCSAVFSTDGQTVFTGCVDHYVRMWDAASGAERRRITVRGEAGDNFDYQIGFSKVREMAMVMNSMNAAEVWDLGSGKRRAVLDDGKDKAWTAYFAPDGKTVCSTGDFEGVLFWDSASGKKLRRIAVDVGDHSSIAFSPDGKMLAVQGDHHVMFGGLVAGGEGTTDLSFWDVAAAKQLRKWSLSNQVGLTGLLFSPDGRTVSAANTLATVKRWDATTGKEESPLAFPKGMTSTELMNCVAFSPDGKTIAAGSWTGPVYLWEVGTTKARAVFTGHNGPVNSLDFSPDGARLISGSEDTTALIWDLTGLADEKEPKTLTSEKLAGLWDELADVDAGKAWRAGWRLVADPASSVRFLQKHMRPAWADASRIAKLITALDGDTFDGREEASHELAKLGDLAESALRKAIAEKPSLEERRHLEDLVNKLESPITMPEQARDLRCVEVLEHIGSPEARRLLKELGKGAEGARVTREAKASLDRLSKSASTPSHP